MPDLVKHGDDLNKVVGATAFHMAVDVLYRGVEGKPALARRRLKTVKEMLRHGADPDIPGKDGRTVREIAARKKDKPYFNALPRAAQSSRSSAHL